jgi:hypothetical protein
MDNGFARMRLCAGDAPGVNVAVAAGQRVDVLNAVGGGLLELAGKSGTLHRARLARINAPLRNTDSATASQAALTSATFGRWVMASCQAAAAAPPKKPGAKHRPLYCRVDLAGGALALTPRDARRARYDPSQVFGLSGSQRMQYPEAQTRAKHDKRGLWAAR